MHRASFGLLVLAFTAGSISPATSQVAIGAKGGVNFSNLSVAENGEAPEIPYESRTGLLLGVTLGVNVTPWLVLQLGGQYSQAGTKQNEGDVSGLLRLSYLDVPLVAKVYIPTKGSPVMPYLYAGGFVGFEVDCSLRLEGTVTVELDCETVGMKRETNYGAVFGGGTDVRVGPGAVTLDAEYAIGLRNIADDPGMEAHSRVFSIAVGFKVFL